MPRECVRVNNAIRQRRLVDARSQGRCSEAEWQAIVASTGGRCVGCGYVKSLTRDHIEPVYLGGSDRADNIRPLCRSCNSAMGQAKITWTEPPAPLTKERIRAIRARLGEDVSAFTDRFRPSRRFRVAERDMAVIRSWEDGTGWPKPGIVIRLHALERDLTLAPQPERA